MAATLQKFTLSRKQAADFLEISTRSLDRYIRDRKLSARKKGGSILLSEEEIQNFKVARFQNIHGVSPKGLGRVHRHVNNAAPVTIDAETGDIEEEKMEMSVSPKSSQRDQVFEELYEISRKEVKEVHNKLEAAHYRLGQLETQLKHSVPLLDYQEKSELIKEQESMIQGKLRRQEETVEILEQELRSERLNKNIYIGLLFGLLALFPTLFFLFLS